MANFNGTSSFMALGSPAALVLNRDFTLSAWINPSTNVDGGILSHGASAWYLRRNSGHSISFFVSNVGGGIGGGSVLTGGWHHVAVTISTGATANLNLYVDGSNVASGTDTHNYNGGSKQGTIGCDTDGGGLKGEFFAGEIEHACAINKALSAEEVAALARGILPHHLRAANVAIYVPGYGPTLRDFGPNVLPVTGTSIGTSTTNAPTSPLFAFRSRGVGR